MNNTYRVGLDVGSTTAKIAVLDKSDNLIYSRFERHNAKVNELVTEYFGELKERLGDCRLKLCVTGSVGMHTAELLNAEFVQEVVAATVFARNRFPQAKTLIDIGGEDAKVVFFNGKSMELRMNGNCAGGTGAFIDQMSVLMGCDNAKMSKLAETSTHLYPMAARCGVFAKTDIQNLMSRNLPESDIAASIFHSIAVQTVTTLSHGCDFNPPILLCGGPLTFLPSLRRAFSNFLNIPLSDFIVLKEGNLIPALGCAIRSEETEGKSLSDILQRLRPNAPARHKQSGVTACHDGGVGSCAGESKHRVDIEEVLPPLFESEAQHAQWLADKELYATPLYPMKPGTENVVLGIDSGSTTTKIVAARALGEESGQIVFKDYSMNLGNPIKAVSEGLLRMQIAAREAGTELRLLGSCSTGYGEELIKAAFNLDDGIIETMAHYRAASKLMPDVSFILDIGGQDMKAIFVENGAVVRMELNEACSSGCGTFIQTFAQNLGYAVEDFAGIACRATDPCDLGTRCTVFMNSKVKQVMREGATVGDIACGLSYSVVRNCLYKVLKLHGNDNLGNKIVVQGGTMKNDSVVRAFEILSGAHVARSNMPEMMGAYGCALNAISQLSQQASPKAKSIDDLLNMAAYDTRLLNCKGCENNCFVTRYKFAGNRNFYSGNKCERIFNNKGKDERKGENIYTYKYHLLFDRDVKTETEHEKIVGIPRILNMYEDYPFWHALFTTAGFRIVLSSESVFHRYEGALGSVMSDNICFPAKLVHSHIKELDEKLSAPGNPESGFIFMPYVVYEHQDDSRNINSYNCPIVTAYSDVVRSAMTLHTRIDSPVINFRDEKLLRKQVNDYLKGLGVDRSTIRKAYNAAHMAQILYVHQIKEKAENILAESRKRGMLTILLAGRPYHTDPLIQHKLSEMIASLGVNVISDDIVRGDMDTGTGDTYLVRQWAYMNRIIKSGQWCAEQPHDVHFVQMTSFGCGPDSFIQDEIRTIMKEHGKPFTLLKIDDVSNIGSLKLRVRSLIESLQGKATQTTGTAKVDGGKTRRASSGDDFSLPPISRHILAPYFTEYLTPLLPPICRIIGWDVEVLPPSDAESAEYGLKYANNEVCYPATLIVGDFVKALRSGKYDTDKISLVMSQTGGQCRATNYAALIRRAMNANGFENVPLITLGVATSLEEEDENQDGALNVPWMKYAPIIVTMFLYGDTISKMYHAAVVRLKKDAYAIGGENTNPAKALRDKYLHLAAEPIMKNNARGLMDLIAQAAEEFDSIIEDRDVPAVGIVGEIFLKFNPFAHQFVAEKIIDKGYEVVPALLSPFFLQNFVNVIVEKHMGLRCSNVPDFLVKSIYNLIWRREKKINKIASRFRYFRPFTNIFEEAKDVNGVVSLAAQFGEGWLLPSDVISMVKQGVNNVASLQPFGCIANHVVSKGVEKKLKKLYPELNFVSLDFDSGVSSVNVTNRLLLFLDSIAV
ncbi:MAG: acyl-CoA dehydratase activase-related protein [Prevotella sp.]|jgi:predicted CoA-substrate-specific enzyme activase